MSVATAQGLGLRTRRGWVFRDVDLAVEPGELVALTGPAGSGRTSLLLALAGHFRTTEGTRRLDGRAGLGLVPGIHEPESGLTVGELVRERQLLLGRPSPVDIPLDDRRLGRDLAPYERQGLMLRLAPPRGPGPIPAADVGPGLSPVERAHLR